MADGRLAPDVKTIADFRRDHGDAIRKVCREFVVLRRRLKLFADGVIAIDGSRFKAVNYRDKNVNDHRIQVRMQQLEHGINRYLAELDRADRDATLVLPERATRLKDKIAKIKDQMRGLEQIEVKLQSPHERQISLTDPDARSMATSRLIVAHEVTNSVTDRGQLSAMAKAAKKASAHPHPTVLADRGHFEGYEILECERAGIATMVPKPLTSNSKFEGRFDKRDFIDDAHGDAYRCPAGQTAIYRYTNEERGKTLHRYWPSACPRRPIKAKCTPGDYRRITRWAHEDVLDVFQARLDDAPGTSRLRCQTVEHVFGTLKAWMGSTHFLTRTPPCVRTEISLQVLAYNLQRAITILGAKR